MEEIEVLDLDDNVSKIDVKKDNTEVKTNSKKNNKSDKRDNKRKIRKGEKIFLLVNILVIFGIIGIYAYRTVHYYKLVHDVAVNITLKDKLTALTNISYQNDGLYEKDGYFYYKGSKVNNYVYYSGRMFRIIDIKNGIRMIEDETNTNLIWGIEDKYSESLIHEWLNNYLNTLKDYEVYLEENNWCNESIDVSSYSCNDYIKEYVGLISTDDYIKAGGKNSYLNNETYFWTINSDMDNKALYVNDEGGINNLSSNEETYFSYGIRPVITLKEDTSIISGDGTKNNPYIIENLGNAMLRDNSVGSYVRYNNESFRIMNITEDGITLIYNGVLEVEKNYNDVFKYLNNEYLKKFNIDELVKITYSTDEYNVLNKYDYKKSGSESNNYIVIPKIGDMFTNEYENYWLNTISDSKLGLMYTVDNNKMYFGDLKTNKHLIRPIIKLNKEMVVTSGVGTYDNPLIVGDNDVEEN